VGKVFNEVERPKLSPLPAGLFPVFEEAPRTVHQDGYIELQRAYYSVPPEYVGRHKRVINVNGSVPHNTIFH
jgi:hypothetical protein